MPKVTGNTTADAPVEIRLQSSALSPSSFEDRLYTTEADANGDWEYDLIANDDLDPPFTVYEVTEDPAGVATVTTIRVPDAIGGTNALADLSVGYATGITAQDAATVDATYGSEEQGVIDNNRTRIAEIAQILGLE